MSTHTTCGPIARTLTGEECTSLLASGGVGRIAVIVAGQPHIVPVNYAADGDVIVFRTRTGTILTEVSLTQVAFETDGTDDQTRSGWSVCVRGYGRDITDAVDPQSRHLRALPLHTWAPGDRDQWYAVVPQDVSGRRLYPARSTVAAG